jgi:RHS repeat-associated protein
VTRPHAATAVAGTANLSLTYDANGNLTGRSDGVTYVYDAENRMTQRPVSGGSVNYVHDGGGGLLKKTEPGGTTMYVGGIYEVKATGATTKYYAVAGKTVAMRKGIALGYILSDHLGSSTTILTIAASVSSTVKYWPFGLTRGTTGSVPIDKLYTGQQKEPGDALELYHYNARMYSTLMGRFLGVDPIAGGPGNPQSWNPY